MDAAIRTVRNSAKVSDSVVNCAFCSLPLTKDPLTPPPMQSFQNMMILGALIPATCNAYNRLLERVNIHAEEAKREKRQLYFSFERMGNFWGNLEGSEKHCAAAINFDNKNYEPDFWRVLVRGVLRSDIYGYEFGAAEHGTDAGTISPLKSPGLKDHVRRLEDSAKQRNDKLNELMASGQFVPFQDSYGPSNFVADNRNDQCTKVIESARLALEALVIA